MEIQARTEIGLVREQNEDSFLACSHRQLMVVADGMGGHQAGEIASQLTVQVFNRCIRKIEGEIDPLNLLAAVVQEANREILRYASRYSGYQGMGTTLTAALIKRNYLYLAHVGDSRAYLIRSGMIRRLTVDHSVVEELLRKGVISEEEAAHHPYRNVLTRALGTEPEVKVDLIKEVFQPGDYLLLCTDGLTNLVLDLEICDLISRAGTLKDALDQLVNLALLRGGHDNITVVLVELAYRGEVS